MQAGFSECCEKRSLAVELGSGSGTVISTSSGGGGMMSQKSCSLTILPRCTMEVWLEWAFMVISVPMLSRPERVVDDTISKLSPAGPSMP